MVSYNFSLRFQLCYIFRLQVVVMDLSEWDSWSIDFNSGSFQNESIFPGLDEIPSFDWSTNDTSPMGLHFDFQHSPELPEMEFLTPGNTEAPWLPSGNDRFTGGQGTSQDHELHTSTHQDGPQQVTTSEETQLPLEEEQLLHQGVPTIGAATTEGQPAKEKKPVSQEKKDRRCQGDLLPGVFCFLANSDAPTFQQRARYSSEQRKNIREIKSLGACVRCRHLKKPVSYPITLYFY